MNQIIEDVLKLGTPTQNNAVKCAAFYRAILSAQNDLNDLDSEDCLKKPLSAIPDKRQVVGNIVFHRREGH